MWPGPAIEALAGDAHGPGSSNALWGEAFSPDSKLLAAAYGGTTALWDVARPAEPRLLTVLGRPRRAAATVLVRGWHHRGHCPGRPLGGHVRVRWETTLWNVARPRHPALLAILRPGSSNALWGGAFSPDSKLLAAAYGGTTALWDVARPAEPRLLTVLAAHVGPVTHADIAFSPDGHLLALANGNGQVTIWDVTRPARAAPVATITVRDDYFQALAFSPQGDLLAGVTTAGTVLVYRLDNPGRPALTASRSGLAAQALYPGRVRAPAGLAASCPGCTTPSYALGFAPGGRALTVVLDKIFPDNSSRDTTFSWRVTAFGTLTGGTSATDDGWDGQPTVGPDGRTIVDGSAYGRTAVGLRELPAAAG